MSKDTERNLESYACNKYLNSTIYLGRQTGKTKFRAMYYLSIIKDIALVKGLKKEDLPLYLNDKSTIVRDLVAWRLKNA